MATNKQNQAPHDTDMYSSNLATRSTKTEPQAKEPPKEFVEIERVVQSTELSLSAAKGEIIRAFAMADGIAKLKAMITPDLMALVMPLQGTSLGFRTDKDASGGYPVETVKNCAIEAVLRGASLVGNEFNIIAGRTYFTKEFFQRKIGKLPGITDVKLLPGIPSMREGGAIVKYRVEWRQNGTPCCVDREIPVRVNSGMGVDGIIGKATRKALKSAYEQIVGSDVAFPDGEVDDGFKIEIQAGQARGGVDVLRERLAASSEVSEEKPQA